MNNQRCKECGKTAELSVDGKFCNESCKIIHRRRYYRELRRMINNLNRQF